MYILLRLQNIGMNKDSLKTLPPWGSGVLGLCIHSLFAILHHNYILKNTIKFESNFYHKYLAMMCNMQKIVNFT